MQVLPYLLTLESKSLDCLHSYCNLWEHFSDWLIKRSMVFTVESYRIVCTKLPFSSKPSTLVASWFKCPIYVSWRFPGKDSHRALNGGRIPEPSKSSKISVYLWNVRKCIIVVHNLDFYVMPNHQWRKIVSFEWSNIHSVCVIRTVVILQLVSENWCCLWVLLNFQKNDWSFVAYVLIFD